MNNDENLKEPAISGSVLNDGLGAVLTYKTSGRNGICGQTMGADGSGEYSMLIYGTPDDADTYARDYIKRMELSGYKILSASIVRNEEGFCGSFITTANAPNAQLTGC